MEMTWYIHWNTFITRNSTQNLYFYIWQKSTYDLNQSSFQANFMLSMADFI